VIDERAAAAMCYTSGTTGNPKGVLYSHRSAVLHSLGTGLTDSLGVSGSDRVLPVVPMFHANAWGLPYACALFGASLVMPSQFLQAEPIVGLIESEKVTFAGAVPTIWLDVLRYADEHGSDLSSLRSVVCGGSAVPRSLMEAFEDRHGVEIVQAWGMTETSPLGSVAHPPKGAEGEERWGYKVSQGKIAPFVEARIISAEGDELPWDGETTGELEVRGPWVAAAYYNDADGSRDRFDDGWLRTGDIASIDEHGYIRISDRSKDVIKSGGEWISSVELEVELIAHPAVREAAVIAMPDERWSERPLACVVLEDSATDTTPDELRTFLADRVAKWWLPENFAFIEEVPKTSVGKFDKKVLRARFAEGELEVVHLERAADPARERAADPARERAADPAR
jgi:fatty-acyl-CoA synthase